MVLNYTIISLLSDIMGEPVRIASKESIRKGRHRNMPNIFIGWGIHLARDNLLSQ